MNSFSGYTGMLLRLFLCTILMVGLIAAYESAPQTSSKKIIPTTAPLIIGDSITYGARFRIQRALPWYHIDARSGRLVSSSILVLHNYIWEWGFPSKLVIELGTNTVGDWTLQDYQLLVDMVPRTTEVIFVTPFVAANNLDPALRRGSLAAGRTHDYAEWMYQLAESNNNVCVDPWRSMAIRRPELLDSDGVHPTHPAGSKVFTKLLVSNIGKPGCQGYTFN